ncbi:phosphoglycerate kinase [Desulfonatronospira sp.]|uniref:phosphoglycerate kinase n=1 Tax=Desulfonatronospira sp. TaxID=1962951 RepID=UPI0025BF80EC|nr:phosphoglycerate kinase [Desulfonatronospira sp.]
MKFIDGMDLSGKTILVRVDFNVPLKDGRVQDETRIQASIPTLKYAMKQNARLVLCSHLGKPKGRKMPELSLAPVAERLGSILGMNIPLAPDCIGEQTREMVNGLESGGVLMLENLRFHPGEEKNDDDFSKELSRMGEVYVNDAFGVSHRAHASVVGVTRHMSSCLGGLLLKKEWEYLSKVGDPARPFVLIAGGAKVSSKLGVLENLLDKVDAMLIGGAMANTFIKANGYSVGTSRVEDDLLDKAREIMQKAMDMNVQFYLPVDFMLGQGPDAESGEGVCPFQGIPAHLMALDIGPATCTLFSEVLHRAKTVIWNGPMGAFENRPFSQGSRNIAEIAAGLQATTIVGGGDTDALIHELKLQDKYSFISTGGGSFMEFLEGKTLPGFKALEECIN